MQEFIDKAKILIEALPYIKKFSGFTIVIKYGGSVLINEAIKTSVIQDIALMKFVGFKPIIVHGGGSDINQMLSRLDIEPKFINGLRVTDEPTMEIVEMVLGGKLNKAITSELTLQGVKAVGISGKDSHMMKVSRLKPSGQDIGFVGEVVSIDTQLIRTLVENDFIPVIAPIGVDEDGQTYNINADYAAVAVAGALNANKLEFLTDVSGVMLDMNDKSSVISKISASQINRMIESGAITGGMIPKVQCCMAAINAGVKEVHIIDGRLEHCLLLETFTHKGIGTLIEA